MSTIEEINQQILLFTRECVKKEIEKHGKIENIEDCVKKIFQLGHYNFAHFIPHTTDEKLLKSITEEFNKHMTNAYGYPNMANYGGWRDKCKIYTIAKLYTYYAFAVSIEHLKEEIIEEIKRF